MFGDLFHDPFGPESQERPSDNDTTAMHLMGCLYAIVGIAVLIVLISIIYLLVTHGT
jgi:hypothetical protein